VLLGIKPTTAFGSPKDYFIDDFVDSIHTIYPKEKEQQYGVLGIKIKLLD